MGTTLINISNTRLDLRFANGREEIVFPFGEIEVNAQEIEEPRIQRLIKERKLLAKY
jgi:hypothetical protein